MFFAVTGLLVSESVRPKKINCLLPVTVQKQNRVGRSVKDFFLHYCFGQECVFYACFTLIGSLMGDKNFRVGKQTTFFLGLSLGTQAIGLEAQHVLIGTVQQLV